MRKILISSVSILVLTAGVALAQGDGGPPSPSGSTITNTNLEVPIVKNSQAGGSGVNSSATSGGTALSANLNNNFNTSSSNNQSNSNNESVVKAIDGGTIANNSSLSSTSSHTRIDVKLATAVSNGSVGGNRVENEPNEDHMSANATQNYVNGGTGILTAEQNTGANALQQTSVALSSMVSGSNSSQP